MRVAGIEITGHGGIGDLALDFRSPDGRAPRHIVLAGGNGCGKTVVLEAIFAALIPTTLLMNTRSLYASGSAVVFIEPDFETRRSQTGGSLEGAFTPETLRRWGGFTGWAIQLRWDVPSIETPVRAIYDMGGRTIIGATGEPARSLGNPFGAYFSAANTTFDVPPIRSITASSSPSPTHALAADIYPLFGTSALASTIPQLFVDLESADGNAVMRWLRENHGRRVPDEMMNVRIRRFQQAFERLIPQKSFHGTDVVDGEIVPLFIENGRTTPMAKLSTGEKQIVFRGAFLLRQADHMPGAVVMIDEPELSLHPNWQSGILNYYDQIVTETDQKKSQIILATHSPFVVHGSPAAKHIILRRDGQTGTVTVHERATFPGVTTEEVAIAAFDMDSLLFSRRGNTMIVATEGKTDAEMIRTAWEKRRPGRFIPFDLMPSGSAGSLRQFLGHEPNASGPLAEALAGRGINRVLGVFDFDREGHGHWNKGRKPQSNISEEDLNLHTGAWWRRRGTNVWSTLLPLPSHRPTAAGLGDGTEATSILTTELLFDDAQLDGMVQHVQVRHAPRGVTRPEASNAQKSHIAAAAQAFPADAFASFEPLLALIEMLLAKEL